MTADFPMDQETEAKILRQVEFYFSDSNLPRDRFLLKSIDESEDGLVSLAVVCSFSRMRSFLGLKEPGADKATPEVLFKVAEVLRKSSELHVSDDGSKVGRASRLLKPEEVQAEVDARSIAANPLPWNVTMDQVESFFSEFAKVRSVRLYRHPGTKVFSGVSVIELSSEEEAQKVLEMKLVYEGAELELKCKKDFDETLRTEFSHANEIRLSNDNEKAFVGAWKNERMKAEQVEDFTKGVIVSFKLVKIQKAENNNEEAVRDTDGACVDQKSEEKSVGPSEEASDVGTSAPSADKKPADEKFADRSKDASDLTVLTRGDLKEALGKYGTIKFVDFSPGDTSGYLRFELPDAAKKARAAAVLASEGGLVIKTFLVTLEAVEGQAEEAYWRKIKGHGGGRAFDSRRRGRGQYGFGGRRGRGRGRGRGRDDAQPTTLGKHTRFEDDNENGFSSKSQKTE